MIRSLLFLTVSYGAFGQPVTFTATGVFDASGQSRLVLGVAPNTIAVEFLPSTQTLNVTNTSFTTVNLLQARVETTGNPLSVPLPGSAIPFTVTIAQGSAGRTLTGSLSAQFVQRPVMTLNFERTLVTIDGVSYSWSEQALQIWDSFFPAPPPTQYSLPARLTRAQLSFNPPSLRITGEAGVQSAAVLVDVINPSNAVIQSGFFYDFISVQSAGPNRYAVTVRHNLTQPSSTSVLLPFSAEGLPIAYLPVEVNYVPGTRFVASNPGEVAFFHQQGAASPPDQTVNLTSSLAALPATASGFDRTWLSVIPESNVPLLGSTPVPVALRPLVAARLAGSHRTRIRFATLDPLAVNTYVNFYIANGPNTLIPTVSPLGTGSIQVSNTQASYPNGAKVTLTATPAAGYVFGRWTGAISTTANPVTVTVNGETTMIAEFIAATPNCTYTLNPPRMQAHATGDIGKIDIVTQAGCPWSVSQLPPWIVPISATNGAGSGYFNFTVFSNVTGAFFTPGRTAFFRVADSYAMLEQAGEPCQSLSLGFSSAVPAGGADLSVRTTVQNECSFTPYSSRTWIVPPAANGYLVGSEQFYANVGANTSGEPRTGSLLVGGRRIPIIQRAAQPVAPYSDVLPDSVFADHISILKANNVADSCGDKLFCPNDPMTRSSMAEQLVRAMLGTENFAFSQTPVFTDVPETHSHFKWIQKLAELGVTNGCTPSAYCPGDAVTRAQMAAFVARARMRVQPQQVVTQFRSNSFVDYSKFNDPFYGPIHKLRDWGITVGCYENAFCPNDFTTRGQMAAFLVRAFFTPW